MPAPRIVAFVQHMHCEAAHYYPYHMAANKAADSLGWEYKVISPTDMQANSWPPHWEKRLISPRLKHIPRGIRGYCERHQLRACITSAIRDNLSPGAPVILFLEDPERRFLRLFLRSLALLRRRNIRVWIHWHSFPTNDTKINLKLRLHLWRIAWTLTGRPPILTAMTEQLAERWEKAVHHPIALTPYPMGPIEKVDPFVRDDDKILCWFAGSSRPWKGENHIQRLLDSRHPLASQFKVIFTEEAKLVEGRGLTHVRRLPPVLDRQEYVRWMNTADLMLLPYDPAYGRDVQMSGVFVETVLAGGIPVITDGTWMADELRKYGLNDLIVDWTSDQLPATLAALKNDPSLKLRMEKIREHYRSYHCVDGYATCMSDLLGLQPCK